MLMMVKTTTVCSTTEGHTPQTRYLAIHRMWENIWLFPYWFPFPPFSSATIAVPFFWLFLSSHSSYYFVNNDSVFTWRQDLFLIFANTVYTMYTRFEIEEGDDGVHFPTCLLFFYSYLRAILARFKLLLSYFLASEKNEIFFFIFFFHTKNKIFLTYDQQWRHDILKVEKIF